MKTLSAKYSVFTVLLVLWVVLVLIWFDVKQDVPGSSTRGIVAGLVLVMVSGLIARFTVRVMARPLANLQRGLSAVQMGRLEKIRVSRTGDEIETLGETFNRMVDSLTSFRAELRQHQDLLEARLSERTEELERATAKALEAHKTISELVAHLSGELRTPMNGVLSMPGTAPDSRLAPNQRKHLDTAQRCDYSLLDRLNDRLDLASTESSRVTIESNPFGLGGDRKKSWTSACTSSRERIGG